MRLEARKYLDKLDGPLAARVTKLSTLRREVQGLLNDSPGA